MQLPQEFLASIGSVPGFDKESFERIHDSGGQVTSIRINPFKSPADLLNDFLLKGNVPWSRFGHYLAERPSFTFDPLFHAGCYYVQEASSMFLEQALKQTADLSQPLKVLDLCAAPGGKSTHIQSLINKESLLVSNEVIRQRANILKDNIIKWGAANVMVTNNDPKDFERLENFFDVIVVDAPCSGSGLFRREPEAIAEWSLNNVALCSQRQQRILADVWPSLKQNGILVYSTCSYSKEEDEDILDWLAAQFSVTGISLNIADFDGIIETKTSNGGFGYRFFPDKVEGEGFFIAAFRKNEGGIKSVNIPKNKIATVTKKEGELAKNWISGDGVSLVKNENTVYAWPEVLGDEMNIVLANLKVIYSGVLVGELMRDKLVPDHALAMSELIRSSIPKIELNYEQSIQYLQRKDMNVEIKVKGWQLVTYKSRPLGWINVLPNRINNYYPKELRILKDKPE